MTKNLDDIKMEIAILMDEKSLKEALPLVIEHFPFFAFNLKSSVFCALDIYREVNDKEYHNAHYFRNL